MLDYQQYQLAQYGVKVLVVQGVLETLPVNPVAVAVARGVMEPLLIQTLQLMVVMAETPTSLMEQFPLPTAAAPLEELLEPARLSAAELVELEVESAFLEGELPQQNQQFLLLGPD
jgi:hypothetical protein